jgi:capsular exopolysaccharide synthesis family protein
VDEALGVDLEPHREKKREHAGALAEIVRREWESAVGELEAASRAIAELQAENGLLAGLDRTPLQTKLDDASAALHLAHLRTLELEAEHRELLDASVDEARFRARGAHWRAKAPVAALEDASKARQAGRVDKEAELVRLERAFGPDHARLATLRAELAALRVADEDTTLAYARHYLASTEVERARARLFEDSLAAEQRALLAQVTGQNAVIDRIRDLEIERGHLRERVADFDERISQLELEHETGALNLDVIEYARAPVKPAYPPAEKATLYALGLGAMLAFGLVLLLGLADKTVRHVEEVPPLLGTSVLGVLPQLPRGVSRATVARLAADEPRSPTSEAIRSACTAASSALPGGRGALLVAASGPGEGASTSASNLALSFARSGKRTLLVDAVLRAPAQDRIHGVPAGIGLAGLLSSSAPLKAAIVPEVARGLDLLPAGDARGMAAELFDGDVIARLLETLRESYDCVVIDAPPVLAAAEVRRLAVLVDGIVIVLRLDRATKPAVERAAGMLRGVGARILGVLVNGASAHGGARDYAGGIAWGEAGESARPAGSATPAEDGQESVRERGTGFLGLEEESA